MIEIREEEQKDYDSVRILNDLAFGQSAEGHIVDKLRKTCKQTISLVAVSGEKIVGHIFLVQLQLHIMKHILLAWD